MKDAQAKEDLTNYPAKFWCKVFMKTEVKCDSVNNKMCEAFNGTIVKARSNPIVKMLEDIRVVTMTRIARCRKHVEKWPGNFGPMIMKKLNENIVEGIGWHVDFNGDDGYETKKGRQQFKVKLQGKYAHADLGTSLVVVLPQVVILPQQVYLLLSLLLLLPQLLCHLLPL
nr:uncharacterized protein LOC109184147 [Ipomoea batatas]